MVVVVVSESKGVELGLKTKTTPLHTITTGVPWYLVYGRSWP